MKYSRARESMVQTQLVGRGINDPRILKAMGRIAREEFVDAKLKHLAYRDRALPIAQGQTISQPFVVALMTLALSVREGDHLLEIGTGSGYQAAVLAELGADVVSIERYDVLADEARDRLKELGYDSVEVICADGSLGWERAAPYDGIIVSASGPTIPPELLDQLKEGRHLVMPVERGATQELVRITRQREGRYLRTDLGQVSFVPLIGEGGWDERERGFRW